MFHDDDVLTIGVSLVHVAFSYDAKRLLVGAATVLAEFGLHIEDVSTRAVAF